MSRIPQLLELLKADPDDPFLHYALALEYGKSNDIPKAIELIEALLARNKDYLGGYYQLGQYYELNGSPEKAASTYKRGILIAQAQKNRKILGELNQALLLLED